ncbi:hypothetical protein E2C01_037705 [Portunus trituberculatus]|uniref:Uncharacterized protein n=1 Tax=Portunus trituberculatus TaxID=210409 RepID=A0A5B7FFB0_PORTR|nr:hypothetical protein [Portunus trituberculatus]
MQIHNFLLSLLHCTHGYLECLLFLAQDLPEGIKGVFTAAHTWGDHGNHTSLALISNERVSQYLSQLGSSERKMSSFTSQGTDTFLQGQQ